MRNLLENDFVFPSKRTLRKQKQEEGREGGKEVGEGRKEGRKTDWEHLPIDVRLIKGGKVVSRCYMFLMK